jgi:hypothetical protein
VIHYHALTVNLELIGLNQKHSIDPIMSQSATKPSVASPSSSDLGQLFEAFLAPDHAQGGGATPADYLENLASVAGAPITSAAFAAAVDTADPLASFRQRFHVRQPPPPPPHPPAPTRTHPPTHAHPRPRPRSHEMW